MAFLDVNNDANIKLTAKLEKLHRSAFPSAVRNTINQVAFDAKSKVPKVSAQKFVTRNKTFFKAFTTVKKAQGFNVQKMKSVMGVNSRKKTAMGGGSRVAEGLEKQETGGTIKGRKLVAHPHARTSKSNSKRISARNRFNRVNYHDGTGAFRAHIGSRNSKFVAAVMGMAKSGKSHLLLRTGSRGMIYQVTGVNRTKRGKVKFRVKKLYSYRNTRSSRVRKTGFMKASSELAYRNIDDIYTEKAHFQFQKYLG